MIWRCCHIYVVVDSSRHLGTWRQPIYRLFNPTTESAVPNSSTKQPIYFYYLC